MLQFVLGYGHSEFTRVCLEAIYQNTPPEEIHLVVWENHSPDPLGPADIDPANTVLLKMDRNYGCSTALNSMIKDFGLGLDQDVMYISNDHYVFPNWIAPLLDNREGFDAANPMHSFGLPGLHDQLASFVDFRTSAKRDYLDHPESKTRIKEFIRLIYGDDLERFLKEKIASLPEVASRDQFWAGCFLLRRNLLSQVEPFRTDRGLAGDEDPTLVRSKPKRPLPEGGCTATPTFIISKASRSAGGICPWTARTILVPPSRLCRTMPEVSLPGASGVLQR